MENYQNLVGKLLAGENITILQKRMETAAFDIKTRTLYLPIWKNMTPEINDMLICHEVSHALFTPMDYVEALDKKLKFKNARSYLNILEDVRVERLIKKKYPGIKKSFSVGYKQLGEKDFFGIKNKNLSESHLMDKINLFYKLGFDCGVTFTDEEKVFVNRAGKTETIQDVIKLAEDIFSFIKESKKKEEEQEIPESSMPSKSLTGEESESEEMTSESSESSENDSNEEESDSEAESTDASGDESGEESDASGDESGESEDEEESDSGESSHGAGTGDDESESSSSSDSGEDDSEFDDGEITTEDSFSENSKSLLNTTEERVYIDFEEDISRNRIIPNKMLLNQPIKFEPYHISRVEKFFADNTDTVNYLVKEFEMKKAATSYKRASIAKSGMIDARKLYAYKIKDDLFRRISVVKDGKNHGMVMLLDWSGSMDNCIKDTIEQVAILAMFCKRVNIPFQVLAFADGNCPDEWRNYYRTDKTYNGDNISDKNKDYFMVELFTHKSSNVDFKKSISLAVSGYLENIFGLHGTPLTESLIYMYSYLKTFRKENNVEKLTFITLTDGEGRGFKGCYDYTGQRDAYGNYIKRKYFLKIPSTGKTLEFDNGTASQTGVLMSAIKERYNCSNVGFFITPNKKNDMTYFVRCHYENYNSNMVSNLQKELKKNDLLCLNDITGRDMLFITPTNNLKTFNDNLEINSNASAKKIAKEFSKHMNKKKFSRVILNKFIEIIA